MGGIKELFPCGCWLGPWPIRLNLFMSGKWSHMLDRWWKVLRNISFYSDSCLTALFSTCLLLKAVKALLPTLKQFIWADNQSRPLFDPHEWALLDLTSLIGIYWSLIQMIRVQIKNCFPCLVVPVVVPQEPVLRDIFSTLFTRIVKVPLFYDKSQNISALTSTKQQQKRVPLWIHIIKGRTSIYMFDYNSVKRVMWLWGAPSVVCRSLHRWWTLDGKRLFKSSSFKQQQPDIQLWIQRIIYVETEGFPLAEGCSEYQSTTSDQQRSHSSITCSHWQTWWRSSQNIWRVSWSITWPSAPHAPPLVLVLMAPCYDSACYTVCCSDGGTRRK